MKKGVFESKRWEVVRVVLLGLMGVGLLVLMVSVYFGLGLRARFLGEAGVMYPLMFDNVEAIELGDGQVLEQRFRGHEEKISGLAVNFDATRISNGSVLKVEVENVTGENKQEFELSSNLLQTFRVFNLSMGEELWGEETGNVYVVRIQPQLVEGDAIGFYLRNNVWLAADRLDGELSIDGEVQEQDLVFKPEFLSEQAVGAYAPAAGEIGIFAGRQAGEFRNVLIMMMLAAGLFLWLTGELMRGLSGRQQGWVSLGLVIIGSVVVSYSRRWW